MLYTIENSEIRVQISDMGAELQSICLKADGSEYLWQGDKTFWSGRAYNLFPICGRLSEGKYTYAGKTYEMNLHGFARKTGVRTTFIVKNLDERTMIFAVGGHPGFQVPLTKGEAFEDYYLEFDCPKPARAIVMSPTCYTTRATEPFALEGGKILPLRHDLFDNDAIVLQDMCKAITLKSKKSSKEVRLEYPDMNYLGLWHAPKQRGYLRK